MMDVNKILVFLLSAGGRVILACRDLEKAEQAKAEIMLETANRNVVVKLLDLASMGSIRAFVKDVNASKTLPSFDCP